MTAFDGYFHVGLKQGKVVRLTREGNRSRFKSVIEHYADKSLYVFRHDCIAW